MNFFKSKKWDLSNNSEDGGESSKKQRKGSINDSSVSDNTEVFAEGLKSPECVSILLNCLQNLEKEIKIHGDIAQTTQKIQDIDRTHRLPGKKPNEKSRPIIVKFVRYNTRNLIFKNKKKLKGPRISITENLRAKRMKKLQTAIEEHEFKNLWTQDGKIMYWDAVGGRVKLYYN